MHTPAKQHAVHKDRVTSPQVVPARAVLVDFSRAGKLKIYDDGFYAKTDIIQFGRLLKKFLKACTDLARFRQVK